MRCLSRAETKGATGEQVLCRIGVTVNGDGSARVDEGVGSHAIEMMGSWRSGRAKLHPR